MNKTLDETIEYMEEFNRLFVSANNIDKEIEFGFAVPSVNIFKLKELSKHNDYIAAQNVYEKEFGSYTGELSIDMIRSVGANMVILGHSERRKYFYENDQWINKKLKITLKNNLKSILCIGETLEQYKSHKTKKVIKNSLLKCIAGIGDLSNLVIAYEPLWAIGTGEVASPEIAQDICRYIRTLLPINYQNKIQIQYGGSINPNNVHKILSMLDIDGVLVGGASLIPSKMIQLLAKSKGQ